MRFVLPVHIGPSSRPWIRRHLTMVLVLTAACGSPRTPPDHVIARDDFGNQVSVSDSIGTARIVSLDPSITEILFALGLGPQLVGRTHWDIATDSSRAVPDLGDGIRPNVEAILAAHPTLVFLYASEENRDAARALQAVGLQVVTLRIDRVAQFQQVTELIGRITRRPERAKQVTDSVLATLARVRQATSGKPRVKVFMLAWQNPLLTIGGGSFLTELVSIAGADNVFADLPAPSPQISFEELVRRNPDAILGGPKTFQALRDDPRWKALPAVRDGHLLLMDTVLVAKPAVRLGEAAVSLARLFHPGVIP
ncbi:MAG: helical backbone metal receptor [Gemmatimonadaceae bacterium]